MSDASDSARLPSHTGAMIRFHVANAFCWSILGGFPLLLFFKHHGASATVLGMVAGALPLMTVLQIPAAGFLEQVGYRRFMASAWVVRAAVAAGMAAVAVAAPHTGSANAMALMLGGLILFSVIRGIGSAALLPWFTQLVPDAVRGRYLSRETLWMFAVVLVVSLGGAGVFRLLPGDPGFMVVIATGAVFSVVAIFFLRRVPDVAVEGEGRNRNPVPWRAIAGHRPFRRILVYNALSQLAWTGGAVCIVPMLRDRFGVDEAFMLNLNAAACAASIAGLLFLGSFLDRVGSKPLLIVALCIQFAHFLGWASIAAGVLPLALPALAFQQLTWGVSFAMYHISNMRLVMQTVPPVGRSHFFAIYSVVTMLSAGLFPVLWGLLVDALAGLDHASAGWNWNPFSTVYPMVAAACVAALIALLAVREDKAQSVQAFLNDLLVRTPARALSRLAQKRPLS